MFHSASSSLLLWVDRKWKSYLVMQVFLCHCPSWEMPDGICCLGRLAKCFAIIFPVCSKTENSGLFSLRWRWFAFVNSLHCAVESCAWWDSYSAGRCVWLSPEWRKIPSYQRDDPKTTQKFGAGRGGRGRQEGREAVTEIKDWFYLTIKPELSQNHCEIWLTFIDCLLQEMM